MSSILKGGIVLTKTEFTKYKHVENKIIKLLCKENMSSVYDVSLIFHLIQGYPYCIDTEGHYAYNGNYYESMKELPIEALEQIIKKYQR